MDEWMSLFVTCVFTDRLTTEVSQQMLISNAILAQSVGYLW